MAEAPKSKQPATWESLPIEFRIGVAKLLDEESRLALRQCSKRDKIAIDSLPISLVYLRVSQEPKKFLRTPKLRIEKHQIRKEKVTEQIRKIGLDEAITQFLSIFKWKDAFVEKLEIGIHGWSKKEKDRKQVEKFLMEILKNTKIRKENGYKIGWKVNKLFWNSQIKDTLFPDFLSCFDKDYLTYLRISGPCPISKEAFDTIFELDHWKNLREVIIIGSIDCDGILTHFYNSNSLAIKVKHLKTKELAEFIKNYRSKNLSKENYFCITTTIEMDGNFVAEVSKHFDASIQNQQHEIQTIRGNTYQIFKLLNDEENVFAIGYLGKTAIGIICWEIGNVENDITNQYLRCLIHPDRI